MLARLASGIAALAVLATGFIPGAQASAASPYVQLDLHSVVDGFQVSSYATVSSAVNKDVQSFGICVRDASNANLDYPKLATARITPTGTTITRSKNFNAGTYTYFPCLYADGAWFNVGAAKSFVVGGTAPPSSSTPPSTTAAPTTAAPTSSPTSAASPYAQLDLHSVVDGFLVSSYATVSSAVNKDVQSFGICVRDASNANLDYPKLATARITPTGTTITRSKNFNAGTYTYFPCLYADGAWFNVGAAKSFVVGGTAPPSSSTPPSTTAAPTTTASTTTAPTTTAPTTTATSTPVAMSPTIFLDNFNGPANSLPDASKWGYEVGGSGWGNNELEYYKDSDPDNSSMDGRGNLRITVRAEPFGGKNYTSARIRTRGKFDFLYGTMEARIKIPAGSGLWPAFWTLGTNNNPSQPDIWPNLGEIDVMEAVNSDKGYSATTHAGPSDWSKYKYSPIPARDGAFHVYSAKWSPGTIVFSVDGTLVTTVTKSQTPAGQTWPFDSVHQYLLLNVAMGGNYPGAPNGSAALPATMFVDYVKVTQ